MRLGKFRQETLSLSDDIEIVRVGDLEGVNPFLEEVCIIKGTVYRDMPDDKAFRLFGERPSRRFLALTI
jgi:hypothetical protein